jgi:hypothetical protein
MLVFVAEVAATHVDLDPHHRVVVELLFRRPATAEADMALALFKLVMVHLVP